MWTNCGCHVLLPRFCFPNLLIVSLVVLHNTSCLVLWWLMLENVLAVKLAHTCYLQWRVVLGSGQVCGALEPEVGCVSGQQEVEVACTWRPSGCLWRDFQPGCSDQRPASPQPWCWEEDGGVRSPVTPTAHKVDFFVWFFACFVLNIATFNC